MENFGFQSRAYQEGQAFAAYHDLYSNGSDVTKVGDRFHAEVAAFRFPRMLLFKRHLVGVSHQRGAKRVTRDGFDHMTMQLVLSGQMLSTAGDTTRVVQAGEIILFDMAKTQQTVTQDAHVATISLARDAIDKAIPHGTDRHGLVLPFGEAGLLRDFVRSLTLRADTLTGDLAATATQTVGAFLGAALGTRHSLESAPIAHVEALRIDRVLAYIDANLASPYLSVEKITATVAMSRSALYRMFEPLGGVARCVLQKRLVRLRRALAQPGETRSVTALIESCGFTSVSHANRAFHQAFGAPPGEYRAELRRTRVRSASPGPAKALFNSWLSELL